VEGIRNSYYASTNERLYFSKGRYDNVCYRFFGIGNFVRIEIKTDGGKAILRMKSYTP
jgi:hypothetical protein